MHILPWTGKEGILGTHLSWLSSSIHRCVGGISMGAGSGPLPLRNSLSGSTKTLARPFRRPGETSLAQTLSLSPYGQEMTVRLPAPTYLGGIPGRTFS